MLLNATAKPELKQKKKEISMEEKIRAAETPKYYNESHRKIMQRYRKKRKTIQITLTYKIWKKALMEEQAAKRGQSMNAYYLGMMEKDAKGMVYIIPDMDRDEAVARIGEIVNMAAADEKADAVLEALTGSEAAAVADLTADTGIKGRELIRTLLACASTEMTYIGAETVIESLEEYGAGRDALLAAMRSAGVDPVIPTQCVRSGIRAPEEEIDV